MYVEQFWRCFEETGNINTYLSLKEYEKLYYEHTNLTTMEVREDIDGSGLDGMK